MGVDKLKILHLVDTFEQKYERDQILNVRMCKEAGYNTTVITSTFDSEGNLKGKGYFRDWDDLMRPVRIVRTPSIKVKIPGLDQVLLCLPHPRLLQNYDVIHLYTIGSFYYLLTYLLLGEAKLVIRAELTSKWEKRLDGSKLWRALILPLLKQADAVYSLKESEAGKLSTYIDKVSIVPPYIDCSRFSNVCRGQRNLTFGLFGRITPIKGFLDVVPTLKELVRDYPGINIVLGGAIINKEYASRLLDSLKECPQFRYLEVLPPEEFFGKTDIVMFPSAEETGSISCLEAMASGKVVITPNISPMNKYIVDRINGFTYDSLDELGSILSYLIDNRVLISEIGDRARSRSKSFDLEAGFGRLDNLYRRVLDDN